MHAREGVLVEEHVVVGRPARAEDPLVTAQVKVPLDGARHDSINDCARRAVRVAWRLAAFGDRSLGEKDEFVLFADDNERDCRVKAEPRASLCVAVLLAKTREMRAKEAVRTSDAGEFLLKGRFEFAFRDAICTGTGLARTQT